MGTTDFLALTHSQAQVINTPIQYIRATYGKEICLKNEGNFPLSTIFCLCVGIIFGDKALDENVVNGINRCFACD